MSKTNKILPLFSHPANKWADRMTAILNLSDTYWEEDDAAVRIHILKSLPIEIFENMPDDITGKESINWLKK
jgi:hypothetical protein